YARVERPHAPECFRKQSVVQCIDRCMQSCSVSFVRRSVDELVKLFAWVALHPARYRQSRCQFAERPTSAQRRWTWIATTPNSCLVEATSGRRAIGCQRKTWRAAAHMIDVEP